MTWPNPDAPAASGVTSPVSTDPLEFQGALTLDKNVSFKTAGGNPRIVGFAGAGAGESVRFQVNGVTDGIQGGFAKRQQLYSYWGTEIYGHTETNAAPSLVTQTSTDPAVSVINTIAAIKALIVKAAPSQSGNLFETQDSSGNPLTYIDSAGALNFANSSKISGAPNQINLFGDIVVQGGLFYANRSGAAIKWSNAGSKQTTVGAAGAASALPASPTLYLRVQDSAGTELVIPAYAQA